MPATTVSLGNSGLKVTRVCFGTWQMGQTFWGLQPEDVLIESVLAGFDAGVTFFDTADAYGDGAAERTLGKALAKLPRKEVAVATKVYHHFYPDGHRHPDLSAAYILRECEDSLKRLGIETIDLYQCHAFDPSSALEETIGAMEKLKTQGRIRAYGVSNFTVEQVRSARRHGALATVQQRYNLMEPAIEADLLPYCAAENIGVLAYSPLFHGMLTGKYKGDETFTDFRKTRPTFQGELFRSLCRKVSGLQPLAEKYGMTITQLVLTATLMHSSVSCVIVGIKQPAQIREAAAVMGKEISREDYYAVRTQLA